MSKKQEKTDSDMGVQNAAPEIEFIPEPPECLRIIQLVNIMPLPRLIPVPQILMIKEDSTNADVAEANRYLIVYPPAQSVEDVGIGMLAYVESCTIRESKKQKKKAPKYFALSVIFISRVRVFEAKKREVPGKGFAWEGIWEAVEEEPISEEKWESEEFKSELETLKSRFYALRMIATQVLMRFTLIGVDTNYFLELGVKLHDEFDTTPRDTYGSFLDSLCLYFSDFMRMLSSGGIPAEAAVDVKNIFIELNHKNRMEKLSEVLEYFTTNWKKIFQSGIYDRRGYEFHMETQSGGDKVDEGDDDLTVRYDEIKDSIPQNVRKIIERGFQKLLDDEQTQGMSEDMLKKRLEWILGMPWGVYSAGTDNIKDVECVLNEDHYGLEKIKQRILEFLAVRKLNPSGKSPILCFVGPPGVGKTSLGESIARALGRKFVKISLGGLHDEAEIRGHRSTYVGAFPGKIIKSISDAGSMDPVFMLDEIDKVGHDWRGDPASALIEVLDPEQNNSFEDNYLGIKFDLSRVFFIATANMTDPIDAVLKDRMEVLEISGYAPHDKLEIAKRHLIPKRSRENGFPYTMANGKIIDLDFSDDALLKIIFDYTRETGVRNLEREIDRPYRKVALEIKRGEIPDSGRVEITVENLLHYVGKPKFSESEFSMTFPVGVVPMLAVGSMGGHLIYAEAMKFERGNAERKVKVTGVRGSGEAKERINNLIEESIDNAFDSLTMEGGILYETLEDRHQKGEFYIHVNLHDSAVSKDGPSAGIPMFWLMYGLLTGQAVKPGVAATGEIGLVLSIIGAVGGIREKSLAADRAGMKTLIIPKGNRLDVEDIPEKVRGRMVIKSIASKWDALLEAFPDDKGGKIREHIKKLQNS